MDMLLYGAGLFSGVLGGGDMFLQGYDSVARFSRSVDLLPFRLRNGHSSVEKLAKVMPKF